MTTQTDAVIREALAAAGYDPAGMMPSDRAIWAASRRAAIEAAAEAVRIFGEHDPFAEHYARRIRAMAEG